MDHAFNPAGGLHHAMRGRASGFCVDDDPVAAIDWLLVDGARRVAYVDIDTHHGDGVQDFFFGDPRVLTISLHEDGNYLFPGTGFTDEVGAGEGVGTALNVPLPPYTVGEVYLDAFDAVVPHAVAAFAPTCSLTQLGRDTHVTDPLAHLALTTDDYAALATRLHDLAHTHAHGRWVATGGGGYQIGTVVPRAWTIHFATLAHQPVPDVVPSAWRQRALEATGGDPPPTFLEGRVKLDADRLARVRTQATLAVEDLKRDAFDLLARHT